MQFVKQSGIVNKNTPEKSEAFQYRINRNKYQVYGFYI
jgi:hypothetical protein